MKKKIYLATAFASLFAMGLSAQTQRMVLAEEFTNASCPPCAAQNPAYNTLLGNNTNKVIAIKYQTNWPGVDPMNAQTQTDVAPRVTYYSVSGVPYSPLDGSDAPVSAPNYAGAPANWTQSIIDAAYAIPSPFSLSVTHTMSSDFDSAHVTVTITAAQNYTAGGNLMLRVGMVEKEIDFDAPPGTNGEMVFENVMRKMIPNSTGTNVGSSWTNAQTATYTFDVALPSYVYDKNEVHFVAFLQDDSNKAVQQSGASSPVLVTNDATASAITGLPNGLTCSTTINPTFVLENAGSATLTSCTINYQVDNNPAQTMPWTGSLASAGTTNVALGSINVSGGGTHTLSVWPTMPNNMTDYNNAADTKVGTFLIMGTPIASPLQEGYVSTTFPPTGWGIINADGDAPTWTRRSSTNCGGFAQSSNSAKMDFYSAPAGTVDEMVAVNINMTTASSTTMSFAVAYCQYSTESDQLDVMVSTDCGATWSNVFSKAGSTLSTKTAQTAAFTPNAASQWRWEYVDLSAYGSATNLIIKFVATSDYGNNLYIDDINLGTVGIAENNNVSNVNIYPNPFDQNATIGINLSASEEVVVNVYNMTGELVLSQNHGTLAAGQHNIALNGANLADGMYFVTVRAGETTVTNKVSVSH
jgi:hypothetical protein